MELCSSGSPFRYFYAARIQGLRGKAGKACGKRVVPDRAGTESDVGASDEAAKKGAMGNRTGSAAAVISAKIASPIMERN